MKKNLIPLLAVAFAVAVISTGIFYGLFVGKLKSTPANRVVTAAKPLRSGTVIAATDLGATEWASEQVPKGMYTDPAVLVGRTVLQQVDEGEPVLESRLIEKAGTGTGGVPEGMRAVSVHVSDSSGVLSLLKPGHHVDVQVFVLRRGQQGPEPEARTAFQNVPVLAVSNQAEPSSQGTFNAPVVTLLVHPNDADTLGLADSFGRIRLALRNPVDQGIETKPALPLAAVFKAAPPAPIPATPQLTQAKSPVRSQVGLNVQLLSASADAINALKKYGVSGKADVLDASQVGNIDKILDELRKNKSLDVLSLSQVNAVVSRSAAVELEAKESNGLRVQFSPFLANGHLRLKVQPEVRTAGGPAPGTRKLETEVDITEGRSFVISGLKDTTSRETGRQVLVLVTPNL